MKLVIRYVFMVAAGMALVLSCGRGGKKPLRETDGDAENTATGITHTISVSDSILNANVADTIDLGLISEGDVVKIDAELHNAGNKPFVVVKVDKTCGCVELEYPRSPLKPGDSYPMPMAFDAKGLSGFVYKTLTLQTSLNAKLHLLVVRAEVKE